MAATQRIRRAPAPRALLLCALGGLFVVAWLLLTSVAAQAAEAGADPARALGVVEEHAAGPLPSPARVGPDLRETTRTTPDGGDGEQPRSQVRRTAQSVAGTVDAVRNGAEDEVGRTTRTVGETLKASTEPVHDTVEETADQVRRRTADVVDTRPLPIPEPPTDPLPVPGIDVPAPDAQDVSDQRRSVSAAHDSRGGVPPPSSTDLSPAPYSLPAQPTLLASSQLATSPVAAVAGDGYGLGGPGAPGAPALPASGSVDLPQRGAGAAFGADAFLTQISDAVDRLAGRVAAVSWWFSQAPAFRPTVSPD